MSEKSEKSDSTLPQSIVEETGILDKGLEEIDDLKSDKHPEKKPEKLKKKALKSENVKLREKLDHLEKVFQKTDKELTEQISKFAFLQAELENTRKHYIKRQEITRNQTKANVITSFTPLIDSLEMAFKNHKEVIEGACSPQLEKYIKGFDGIRKQLLDIFDSYQVTAIDTIQIPLDFKIHDAVLRVVNDDLPDDTVLQIVQKGYRMNGEVIRPAKVIVSKITPPPAPEPISETPPEISSEDKASAQENPSEETEEGHLEGQNQISTDSPELPKII